MVNHLYLIIAMVIVGSSVAAGKVVVADLPVYYSMTLRFLIGSVFLYAFIRYKRLCIRGLGLRAHMIIALQALMGSVLFTLFLFQGMRSITAAASGIISGTLPVMVLLLSVLLVGNRLSINGGISVLLSASGIMLVTISGEEFSATLTGVLFVLAAVGCEASFLLLRKRLPAEISSLVLSLFVSVYGFLFFLPFGAYEIIGGRACEVSFNGYMLIAYYGIFITAAAYILWFKGIVRVRSEYASVYTAVMPVSAVLISSVVLNEQLTLNYFLGLFMVLGAMFVLMLRR